MVSIKLYYKLTGKPAKGVKVGVYSGIFNGVANQYTDDAGEAHFDMSPGEAEAYAEGKTIFKGRLEGMKTLYI